MTNNEKLALIHETRNRLESDMALLVNDLHRGGIREAELVDTYNRMSCENCKLLQEEEAVRWAVRRAA